MAVTGTSTNTASYDVLPYKVDISSIKNYMSALNNTEGISGIESTRYGIHNSVVLGSECLINHSNSIVIGYQGHTTEDNQIVLSAGSNNQLRFTPDGITFNNEAITDDTSISECIKDILKKIKYFELI